MINVQTKNNQISFSGTSYKKIPKALYNNLGEESEHFSKKSIIPTEYSIATRAYANIRNSIRLEYTGFGYRVPKISKAIEPYKGTLNPKDGFSTEPEYGGEWLKGRINTPLSTNELHDCSLLNLVNEDTGEQFLYHILFRTNKNSIKNLINEQFPRFTKANLMAGDHVNTTNTFNDSLSAINEINPKAKKTFYHIMEDSPEIVAVNGKLESIPCVSRQKVTFKVIDNQYNY